MEELVLEKYTTSYYHLSNAMHFTGVDITKKSLCPVSVWHLWKRLMSRNSYSVPCRRKHCRAVQ